MRPQDPSGSLTLVVRRLIPASPDAVFAAWTEPAHLLKWWGPRGVSLAAAEIDLRVGGRYRLANHYQDGSVLWISGVFEVIERPHRITCTWAHEPVSDSTEHTRVTVRFEDRGDGTRSSSRTRESGRATHAGPTARAGPNASTAWPH